VPLGRRDGGERDLENIEVKKRGEGRIRKIA
jgi:hypothetical protein